MNEIKNVPRGTKEKTKFYDYSIINREIEKEEAKGNDIALIIITSNRGDGKTTQTIRKMMECHKQNELFQFAILFRNQSEVADVEKLINSFILLFPEYSGKITSKSYVKGLFVEVLLDDVTLCWGFCMHNVDALKKHSLLFTHIEEMFFDEYQKEDGRYLKDEIKKFLSVCTTIGRGQGMSSRPIKVTLLGNYVTLMNPYLIYLDVHKRIRDNTKFLRGPHWICHFHINEIAKSEMQNNPLLSIFSEEKYLKSSSEGVYLNDSNLFIQSTPKGKNFNLCTIVHNNRYYAVLEFYNNGIVYVTDDKNVVRKNHEQLLAFKDNDHNQNTMLISHYDYIYKSLKSYYHRGILRFRNIESKNMMFDILAIDMY